MQTFRQRSDVVRAPLSDAEPHAARAVAYVMSRFPKLSETFVLTEMVELERRGTRIEVFPLLREREAVTHPEAARIAARAHYLPFLSLAIARSQIWWLARRPVRYLGLIWTILRGAWGSTNFLLGGLAILPKAAHAGRIAMDRGVSHIHCHFANHPATAGMIMSRLTGIPFTFTAHGSDLHVDRHLLSEKVEAAAGVVTISTFNREVITRTCGPRLGRKVRVIGCGVDPEAFAPAPPHDRDELHVLCVGTLHEVKGQATLVDAARLLRDRGRRVRVLFIGDGPDRAMLQRRIREANLDGVVRLGGPRTRTEVAAAMRDADVVVAPSVPTREGKREGIPVVLIEAMASARPVVASALSGIPELVVDGTTGVLVPPGDAEALARALARLGDRDLRAHMGAAGRDRALQGWSLTRSVDQMLALFGEVGHR